jgi:hypothetical protein
MDEDALSSLVLDHLVKALQLAVATLDLVDAPEPVTLSQLRDIETMCDYLEVGTVMLLQQAGVSWETMARHAGGITRQSLHRRMNRKISERVLFKMENRTKRGLQAEWGRLVELLADRVQELSDAGPERMSVQVSRSILERGSRD